MTVRGIDALWLTERELAERLGVHPDTVRRWRRLGIGPEWRRTGPRLVRYRVADVEAWETGGRDAA